jgi:hypothetical protein
LEDDINTFLIVVSVLLTVSELSVVEVVELVLMAVDDVELVAVPENSLLPVRTAFSISI